MDRLNQLRGETGDSTLDTSSPPSEAFMSANESSSKYFSLSEVDSTFSISPSKDAASTTVDSERTITDEAGIIPNLSPIPKADNDTFKIGKHIEAANILSGGVNIFDDNDNSYDGDELVIDDNVVLEDEKAELKLSERAAVPLEKDMETNEETLSEVLEDAEPIPSKDSEVVLQIDGKNVDAIHIGNGLYLYRKSGEKELSAVQIIDDDVQQPSFKFLKVRENAEGNLEVYEEIQIEIPKEVPAKEGTSKEKPTHVPIKDINKVINEPSCNKVIDKVNKTPKIESISISTPPELVDTQESKSEVNINGKMMKFNESRKSPLTFTPMAYHSTPNKEGIPLTKTMVDQQLHPSRHSDNIKKTIEVHTDNSKPKVVETPIKSKETNEPIMLLETFTSIVETKEANCLITAVENRQKKTEIINEDLSKDEVIMPGQVNVLSENSKDQIEIKNTSKNKDCALETPEEISVASDEKVTCEESKEENLKSEELKNIETSQSLTESKELAQNTDTWEEKTTQSPLKENNDYKCDNSCKDESNKIKKELIEDDDDNKLIENKNTSTTVNTPNTLSNEITNNKKLDKFHNLESSKDDTVQSKILKQDCTDQTKLSPKVEAQPKNEKTIDGTKIKDLIDEIRTKIMPITDSKDVADEMDKSDELKIDNSDINLKINEETSKESYPPHENVTQKENDLKTNELKAPINPIASNAESQIKPFILNNDKVQANSIKSEAEPIACTLSALNQKAIESQLVTAAALEPSKITSNDTNIVQPTPLPSPDSNKKANIVSQPITKASVESFKVTSEDINLPQPTLPILNKQVETKKDIPKPKAITKPNNCNSAVPFGKWTEANRQEFLNKIKETKIPSSNTNQIKQTNDLNRRDVLKKFDSQRQSAATVPSKISDFGSVPKFSSKMETAAFVNKSAAIQHPIPVKSDSPVKKQPVNQTPSDVKKEEENENEQKEMSIIINSQELIDNTIEGIITRALKIKTTTPVHMKEQMTIHTVENPKDATPLPGSLDDIEMKMNELHGFSFLERSATELAQHNTKSCNKPENIDASKNTKIPSLLPFKIKEQQQKTGKETAGDDTSDEEIIEHEPITGDIDVTKQNLISLLSCKESFTESKTDAIITEKDFDKFARRNSRTYENCLTVNFDGKEKHNVVQTVVEKEVSVKKLSRNELLLAESKAKCSSKQNNSRHHNLMSKIPTLKSTNEEDSYSKNYQSKVQLAYQSALTAKRNLEGPIPIIEEKPVKVVFMETNTEYNPTQLNVQGQELSPSKNVKDLEVHSASESLDSDILDSTQGAKPQDEKTKKHQRKQVLTPVEEPEMQLIEPSELGFKISSTKKRKIEEKQDKTIKKVVPKKSYLLNRSVVEENKSDQPKAEIFTGHINSAIDNLVKAAELIENQSESNTSVTTKTADIPPNTPVKRGRGRPRKYPLPEPGIEPNKTPSPQKKPRLIDAKPVKTYSDSDESSNGDIVKVENWTMGKIDENIVCPICTKLFRSEDVLFKHVKHCTGPSPNRSDSDKRSPRRLRNSHESDRKLRDSLSDDTDNDTEDEKHQDGVKHQDDVKIKKRNSISQKKKDVDEIIIIEDTPIKPKSDAKVNHSESKKARKLKYHHSTNLVCEFCGKTFRQLSYLANHKLQHANGDRKEPKKLESETTTKPVFSCEVCRKEFRKLHHLVQHRIIHNPSSMASRSIRKTSSDVFENKNSKNQSDDTSAGFRCEPCDKSFRKLHHLVEHRETHDGINKKGNTSALQTQPESSKSALAHHCDVCKKVFKKLQDLLEHKEQHYDTSSEKSDDKSVKSTLSTKDIIHECSLCYMVFPNEQSLTRHTVICLRKKKQSAAKQAAKQAEVKEEDETSENIKPEEDALQDIQPANDSDLIEDFEEPKDTNENDVKLDQVKDHLQSLEDEVKEELEDTNVHVDAKPINDFVPKKRHSVASEKTKTDDVETPAKIKKVEIKERVIVLDTPTPKNNINKDKVKTVKKRHKTADCPLPVVDTVEPMESSDDEEIRYMLNPNFKEEESTESKVFMKIRALKRNSLQIERPNSRDLANRRTSLQHPPKMPRLKAKPVESKTRSDQGKPKNIEKKLNPIIEPTTDSDDSDVKYSFPEREHKSVERKLKRRSMSAKRKSLVGIAKRKSLVKSASPKGRPRKRTAEVEHRCDCGQLFSSAALLSRHTTLAHTPPRIRRRRSPPPDTHTTKHYTKPTHTKPLDTKPKPADTKSKLTDTKPKPTDTKLKPKSDVTSSNKNLGVATRKSSVSNVCNENKSDSKLVKSDNFKLLRSAKSVPFGGNKKLDKWK